MTQKNIDDAHILYYLLTMFPAELDTFGDSTLRIAKKISKRNSREANELIFLASRMHDLAGILDEVKQKALSCNETSPAEK